MSVWLKRIGIYLLGMITVSTGIVLCALCGWGISPISSWAYIMTDIVPLSFGTLTMIFHLVNIIVQYLLEKKLINIRVWLQIPVALIFGILIDAIKGIIMVDTSNVLNQSIALALSVFLTALGMVLMINMNLIQNPPDGCVKNLSELIGIEMGNMKLIYDLVMVVTSGTVGYIALGDFRSFGIATIVSAIFVGKILSGLQKSLGEKLRRILE